MLSMKRLASTTILGLIFGVVSWLIVRGAADTGLPASAVPTLILNRGVLGVALGISAWRIHWVLHGVALGLIFSLPGAFAALWLGGGVLFFLQGLVLGIVFGFLIELITSVGLKARMAVPG